MPAKQAAPYLFIFLFLLKIIKRTVPALTCPYNYRHRMMTILFLLQAWHGYRFTFTQRRSAFLADAASLASFSPKMSSCRKSVFQVCRDRLYVFDSGRFSWNLFLNCDSGFAFYFERELYFFLTRKTFFSKKTALSCIFFRISIDNLGPYMCYVIFLIYILNFIFCFYKWDQ